jgi:hypothetical protein
MMEKMVVDRIIAKGSILSGTDLGALRTMKSTLSDNIYKIE